MELVCDEACIYLTGICEKEYAGLILRMMEYTERRESVSAFFFVRSSDYVLMKKRIRALGRLKTYRSELSEKEASDKYLIYRKRTGLAFALVLTLILLSVFCGSYPRWSDQREMALFNEDMTVQIADTAGLSKTLEIRDGRIEMKDAEGFERILKEKGIEDGYVYLSFGGIQKLPGAGGCGNVGMNNNADFRDITYLAAESTLNRVAAYIFKLI
jgi:hypothetical protein